MALKMFKGKKSQAIVVAILVGILGFIATVNFLPVLIELITGARVDLTCSDTTISTGMKFTCIVVDWALPIFIGICMGAAFSYISGKKPAEFIR